MFGVSEMLIRAIKLTAFPGIYVDESVTDVQYFHILFDEHEIVVAQGTPSESLHTGTGALKNLSVESKGEILAIFPELADPNYMRDLARSTPSGKKLKQLVERHIKNQKALLESYPTVPTVSGF
jgi:hypothetical protein